MIHVVMHWEGFPYIIHLNGSALFRKKNTVKYDGIWKGNGLFCYRKVDQLLISTYMEAKLPDKLDVFKHV